MITQPLTTNEQLHFCIDLLKLLFYRYMCDTYAWGRRFPDSIGDIADLLNTIEPGVTNMLDEAAKHDMLAGSVTNKENKNA